MEILIAVGAYLSMLAVGLLFVAWLTGGSGEHASPTQPAGTLDDASTGTSTMHEATPRG